MFEPFFLTLAKLLQFFPRTPLKYFWDRQKKFSHSIPRHILIVWPLFSWSSNEISVLGGQINDPACSPISWGQNKWFYFLPAHSIEGSSIPTYRHLLANSFTYSWKLLKKNSKCCKIVFTCSLLSLYSTKYQELCNNKM